MLEWNDTARAYPKDELLHELFAAQAKKTPHAVAVRLADFAPVGQSAFCQGWQPCVRNALSVDWIITS